MNHGLVNTHVALSHHLVDVVHAQRVGDYERGHTSMSSIGSCHRLITLRSFSAIGIIGLRSRKTVS